MTRENKFGIYPYLNNNSPLWSQIPVAHVRFVSSKRDRLRQLYPGCAIPNAGDPSLRFFRRRMGFPSL
jgi:hypothetical protein